MSTGKRMPGKAMKKFLSLSAEKSLGDFLMLWGLMISMKHSSKKYIMNLSLIRANNISQSIKCGYLLTKWFQKILLLMFQLRKNLSSWMLNHSKTSNLCLSSQPKTSYQKLKRPYIEIKADPCFKWPNSVANQLTFIKVSSRTSKNFTMSSKFFSNKNMAEKK